MSKLSWDATGERWLEYGVDHGILFVQKSDGTYDDGVVWNGLTGVTHSPEGAEPNDLYADNIKYAVLRSAETFGGTIEAFQSPKEFDACDGMATPFPGLKVGQQGRVPFGFAHRVKIANDTASESDDGYKWVLIYNATANPSEQSHETVNENPDAMTYSWEFTTTPIVLDETAITVTLPTGMKLKPMSKIEIDSRYVATAKLTALEDLLCGTNNANSKLPSPEEVINLIGAT